MKKIIKPSKYSGCCNHPAFAYIPKNIIFVIPNRQQQKYKNSKTQT